MATPAPVTRPILGSLLRQWRALHGKSQLDLAVEAGTTPRYVSFVETGRAQPSRQMVVRLARALGVPLRERNDLLLAAGFAPVYSEESLESPLLEHVERALSLMLAHHEPFPAVVMDRGWNLQRANAGAQTLFGRLFEPDPMPAEANVLRLIVEPGPVRDHIVNWPAVVVVLLERARREAVGGIFDRATAALVADLRARGDVGRLLAAPDPAVAAAPVVDVRFAVDGLDLSFFSVVSTIGTPIDITAQELRLEAFFPADDATRLHWAELVGTQSATDDPDLAGSTRAGSEEAD